MIRLSSLSSTRRRVWPTGGEGSTWIRRWVGDCDVPHSRKADAQRSSAPPPGRRLSPLHRGNLSQSAPMSLGTGEAGAQEVTDQLRCQLDADHTGPEAEYVHIGVLAALAG